MQFAGGPSSKDKEIVKKRILNRILEKPGRQMKNDRVNAASMDVIEWKIRIGKN